ncbi:Uncharacterized protein MSYG_1104 [Malassezia sympodialis ATCC 42132]|uniref:Uncharacterized protein n=1 Tax=Malassezia sympodialis (strain ATCC 42132) TaxID=1230383 RepID=A0A1M8A2U7_MALS4|nr:Uncharacterized protein MSYG_1104 [Malassezia sympodialis ATCC 42132]
MLQQGSVGLVFAFVVFSITLLFEIAIAIGIILPVTNALTRLRANFLPRAVSLDSVMEDGRGPEPERTNIFTRLIPWRHEKSSKIGPVVPGLWAMMQRIRRLEGWRGLFKGATPMGILMIVSVLIVASRVDFSYMSSGHLKPSGEIHPIGDFMLSIITYLAAFPFELLMRRTMAHPAFVNWQRPRTALRQVLSPKEVLQPWRLYMIPGLVPAVLLRNVILIRLTLLMRHLLVPAFDRLKNVAPADPKDDVFEGPTSALYQISTMGMLTFLLWVGVVACVCTVLDCVLVRLMIQYDQSTTMSAPAPHNHQAQVDAEPMSASEQQLTQEPVLSLRYCFNADNTSLNYFVTPQVEPYAGLFDCIQKMYREEGPESLFRGMLYTFLGFAFVVFSSEA